MRLSGSKKLAKDKADKYFSLFIRDRDCKNGHCKCITCGKIVSYEETDCGHFISRSFEATRYDEKNSHAQCRKCNRFQYGRQFEYALAIDKVYGKGTAEALLQKSKQLCKRNKYDYEVLAEYYKSKLR